MNGVNYTWDNNGNLLNDGVNAYTYNTANQLKTMTGPSVAASYAYNGLGDRLQEIANGQTTSFRMDYNTGLTQVLNDGTNNYIYGNERIAQVNTGTEYFLGDALGSVRQLTNTSGAITYARAYDPYGVTTQTYGSSQSAYGYTGEFTSNEMVYLRARMYSPNMGRFFTRDVWEGDVNNPMSLNRWMYVEGNPINYTDPSGYVLDPSEPTHRGTIIHKMITLQYIDMYASGGIIEPGMRIPMGSARGLKKIKKDGEIFWGKDNETITNGYADIVDWGISGLYEIKPYRAAGLGQGTVYWYLEIWNNHPDRLVDHKYLTPGGLYPTSPTIVGTDPDNVMYWITAEAYGNGVIIYSKMKKPGSITVPVFVWEWDPVDQKVIRRSGAKAARWHPEPDYGLAVIGIGILAELLKDCGPLIPLFVP